MNENILYNFLKNKPSFLDYDDELKLIGIMTKLPMSWFIKNKDEFIDALMNLSDSHTIGSGFLFQDENDDIIFDNFCEWLKEVNNKTGIPTLMYIDDFDPKELGLDEFRKNIRKDENTDK
ncbi:hypothetical protein [Gilliamella sp. Occ4-3]|uniref:hypothetical protein n=1 Tax=Gilliamella sp. Occ4-3 TaxID=3120254 RepID=UPI00080E6387|nr:hypothetical protein [Gilliamella apicola]OCG77985.1 hypothetical protein A9G44_03075 [Gilliamella apicola]